MKIGTHLRIGFGQLIVMMLIANMCFATKGGINSRIIEKDWVKVPNVANATTSANARRTIAPLIVTNKSQVARANERIEADKKTINEVLAAVDMLIDLSEGLRITPTVNTRDS